MPAETTYSADIPTPASQLGYEIGEWHVRHDQLVAYMHTVARSSPRVQIETIGKTYEDRPLLHLTISSPANLERLDAIRTLHRERLAGSGDLPKDLGDLPAMVWLSYGIHGNESSASNASLVVAYHLAAAEGADVDELLKNVVIMLDPCLNPDGFSLFGTWVNAHKGRTLVSHPLHREHTAVWPHGRANHYWFDLNRDWLFTQQRESRAQNQQLYRWLPQVLADFHETGTDTTAYFQPGAPNRIHPLTTTPNQELTHRFSEFNAAAYDKAGILYYTKERFDDFSHCKSSTFSDLIGAIGLTFEVGSTRGHIKDSMHGKVTFPLTIKKQFIQSLATLRGAARMKSELLAYQRDFFASAISAAQADRVQGYVVADDGDPARFAEFAQLLRRHQVEIYRLARDEVVGGVRFTEQDSLFVPAQQRQYRLVKSLFERRTEFEDSVFYDTSTWNAPLAFNLPFAELRDVDGIQGAEFDARNHQSPPPTAASDYAYAFSWHDYWAPQTLQLLLQEKVNVRVATRPFTIRTSRGQQSFDRGSIVVPVRLQEKLSRPLLDIVHTASKASGVEIYSIPGGLATAGIDIGSRSMRRIEPIRPMLLVGEGVKRTEAGEVWHLLDRRLGIELPLIELANIGEVKLSDFTHLIMVEGDYAALDKAVVNKMHRWVEGGGTLITQQSASRWAETNGFLTLDANPPYIDLGEKTEPMQQSQWNPIDPHTYAEQEQAAGRKKIAGAMFRVEIDSTHPIGYGYHRGEAAVMRRSTEVLPSVPNPAALPARYASEPLLCGYASPENLKRIGGTPAVIAAKNGDGTVIAFADNPNFRGYFFGTNKLFLNALFFGKVIRYVK